MKSRTYSKYAYPGVGVPAVLIERYTATWDTSPRVAGKLKLRSNPYNLFHERGVYTSSGKDFNPDPVGWMDRSDPHIARCAVSATNQARARFVGKLHKGGASLGVTVGSASQSINMVRDRASKALRQIAALEARAASIGYLVSSDTGLSGRDRRRRNNRRAWSSRRVKRVKESIASSYLEVVFGWKPLLQDVHNSLFTVCQQAIPPVSVGGKGYAVDTYVVVRKGSYEPTYAYYKASVRVSINALVSVANPNLWLANRLGVINPAVVAWDLVPWSFVVNMFANVNSVLQSMTDLVGLTFQNEATTTTTSLVGSRYVTNNYPVGNIRYANATNDSIGRYKTRSIGGIPRPQLELRVPDLDTSLASVAVALLVQRSKRLAGFLSL